MKSFKNESNGVVLTPKNKWVESQLIKNKTYVAIEEETSEKAISDYTIKELVEYLTSLNIECNAKMKKADLLALVPDNEDSDNEDSDNEDSDTEDSDTEE